MTRFKAAVVLGFGIATAGGVSMLAAAAPPRKAEPGGKQAAPQPKITIKQSAPVRVAETVWPYFDIWQSKVTKPQTPKATLDHIRETLSEMDFEPAHRRQHFAWLEEYGLQAKTWAAEVIVTEPIEDGLLVSLRIYPRLAGGPTLGVLDYSIERYKVFNDGTWEFVDAVTPPGKGVPALMMY